MKMLLQFSFEKDNVPLWKINTQILNTTTLHDQSWLTRRPIILRKCFSLMWKKRITMNKKTESAMVESPVVTQLHRV